ncbi:ceramidase domain-containing protein [Pannonibacter sp.]|uniref:ceramidase domain-containing protein n=1 Tax=Pannonibacter sp. TaxID=1906786 RepID=UPI003F6E44C3
MNWTENLDFYCERLDASFWAEPLNAASSTAFLVAAAVALRVWFNLRNRDYGALSLILLIAGIGIGSFLFHTFANRWSMKADMIPATTFTQMYMMLALIRFLGAPFGTAIGTMILFTVISPLVALLAEPFLGPSSNDLPALAAIFVVGALCFRRSRDTALGLVATGALFTLSLTFRTLDGPVCGALPFGTHFLWHVCNAGVLFLLMWLYMRAAPAEAAGKTHGAATA